MGSWGLMVPVWVIPGLPTWDPAVGSSHFVVGTLKSILPREKHGKIVGDFSKIKMWMMIDGDIQCLHMHTYISIYRIYVVYVYYVYIYIHLLIHLAVSEISWRETSMWYRFNVCERYVRQMGNLPSIILGAENKRCERKQDLLVIPSRELTYPPKRAFWRWFSFSQGGIC